MPANVSADIVNLVSFSPFDRCDSNKPEKINISLLPMNIQVIRTETSSNIFFNFEGSKFSGSEVWVFVI